MHHIGSASASVRVAMCAPPPPTVRVETGKCGAGAPMFKRHCLLTHFGSCNGRHYLAMCQLFLTYYEYDNICLERRQRMYDGA